MKSLEIVNEILDSVNIKIKEVQESISNNNMVYGLQALINKKQYVEEIKQDLEVLEILRENLYTEYDTRLYVRHSFDSEHKDFNKVKQWLEREQ